MTVLQTLDQAIVICAKALVADPQDKSFYLGKMQELYTIGNEILNGTALSLHAQSEELNYGSDTEDSSDFFKGQVSARWVYLNAMRLAASLGEKIINRA